MVAGPKYLKEAAKDTELQRRRPPIRSSFLNSESKSLLVDLKKSSVIRQADDSLEFANDLAAALHPFPPLCQQYQTSTRALVQREAYKGYETMRTDTTVLERLDAYDEFYTEARDSALAYLEIALKQRADINQLLEKLKQSKQASVNSVELERLRIEAEGLRTENSQLKTDNLHWQGKHRGLEEIMEKSSQELKDQASASQHALEAKDKKISELRSSLYASEKKADELESKVSMLFEENDHLETLEDDLKAIELELKVKEEVLEKATHEAICAEQLANSSERARRMTINNFIKSPEHKRFVAASGMQQALEYYNRGVDDAAKVFPGVLAIVKKRKVGTLPTIDDESLLQEIPSSSMPPPSA